MKEILRLVRIDFCGLENSESDAISQKTIAVFAGNERRTALGVASDWFSEQSPEKLYLAWNGKIYPQFSLIKEKVVS